MSDEEKRKMIEAQARGFREITLLILSGTAERDQKEFAEKVKDIAWRAALQGA